MQRLPIFSPADVLPVFRIALVIWLAVPAAADPPRPPNIIVIMADDLGYGDVSCYGATAIATPNIDRLADQGLRFTSGYCSASTCTPTRYSFLTGTYAFRGERTGIAPPNAPAIIAPGTTTIASILHDAGYATGVVGKWHLGLGGPEGPDWNGELTPGPLEIGFDECFLLPTTNDRVPQVYLQNRRILHLDPADPLWVGDQKPSPDHPTGLTHRDELKMDWSHGHNSTIHNGISRIGFYTGGHAARFRDEDLADRWVAESIEFIERNHDNPFFLFFASHDLHVPRMPHERFQGTTSLGPRGDSIAQLDWCVGRITDTIDQSGLGEDTLIVFCSDNGPVLDDGYRDDAIGRLGDHDPSGPFQGGKYSVYEGGTRTPMITRWTGRIAPAVSDRMVCTIDLAATVAAMTGQTLPTGQCVDSQDLTDAFLGEADAEGRQSLVQQDNGAAGTFGFRHGDWKLHRYGKPTTTNVDVSQTLGRVKVPPMMLFDLANDPAERHNLVDEKPELAARLNAELQRIIDARGSRPGI